MRYHQKVKIDNIDFEEVKLAFHDFKFIKYLTKFQPVQILKWDGIKDGDSAHFKFWFFGWRQIIVFHKNYMNSENKLSFTDYSKVSLPLGLSSWNHEHVVRKNNESIYIEDYFEFNHNNKFLAYILYPIMIMPIVMRRITYKIFFKYYRMP